MEDTNTNTNSNNNNTHTDINTNNIINTNNQDTQNTHSELITKMLNLNIPLIVYPINPNTQIESALKQGQGPNQIYDKYILVYKHNVDSRVKSNKLNAIQGFKYQHVMHHSINGCAATVNKGLLQQLVDDPDILYMEKDILLETTCYSKNKIDENQNQKQILWHQTMTNTAIATTDNFSNIHCYILDSGILPNHSEFSSGQVILDYNAITKGKDASDDNGHGTAVASLIGGKSVGTANKTILHSIKVIGSSGTGYVSDIVSGLEWVLANKNTPCVINMSLGGSYSSTLNNAVQKCILNNVMVICASGNSGIDSINSSPANTVSAITVSAYDSTKKKPSWSNYGSVVDTFSPGVSVKAAWGDYATSYYLVDGTSFACPIVSGIIVRFLKERPNSTPSDITAFLLRCNIPNEIINVGSTNTPNQRIVWNLSKLNPC